MIQLIQHWLAIHTGTDNETGVYYAFWSGFGSDLGELTLIAGVLAVFQHHICHEPGCFRPAKVAVDTLGTKACYKHHPEGKPTKGHIERKHAEHLEHDAQRRGVAE